ncbi:hypothetical protein B0T21DRAFT_446750 [Apiosordaria backusii]|uniref:RING-type E3 ubiquitin transferase n=1 Tax=Apiosordaria backusii TaxID=314023 RepID=A0AA40K785_9PEZI|nr:hypothetical protein B0T21DRAFT_446750 [Apiosordaria backusii]
MSMSVDEIRNVVLLFSNPSWGGVGTVSSTVIRNVTALSGNMAYSSRYTGNTTVLSNRYAGTTNGVIQGLLYVPDLPYGHECVEETAFHVPQSVARQSSLPPTNYYLIAIAPWVNSRCSRAYLLSARTAPVRGFLFYLPGNSTEPPPSAESELWNIAEEFEWRTQSAYPVYAISSMAGQVMMQHLSLYSGDLTEVPFGNNISTRFRADPEDYARIWTELVISTPPSSFATWLYFLIVVGVLLTVIASASLLMHLVQARRRSSLRHRVISGEVNLEGMGIKRLTVPMEHIESFPLFTYHYEPDTTSPPTSPRSTKSPRSRSRRGSHGHSERRGSRTIRSATISEKSPSGPFAAVTTNYQPYCEICLEPYQNRVTIIRELPCGHIFHPGCIDEFLNENSSLCPLCKASMMPPGFCPKITNNMVKRERAIRKIRGHVEDYEVDNYESGRSHGWTSTFRTKIFSGTSPASSTSTELQVRSKPVEKQPPVSPTQADPSSLQSLSQPSTEPPAGPSVQQVSSRPIPPPPSLPKPTALARERMRELAGSELDDGEAGSSRCKLTSQDQQPTLQCQTNNFAGRRMRAKIFPGFD